MIPVRLVQWAAWSPGIETREAWCDWARAPVRLAREGTADIPFLPPLQRRRCDDLCRAMLHAAHACLKGADPSEVTSVFASRHGSFANMISLLEALARQAPLSPTRFGHSVHNTPAGIFSIWAGNRQASSSIAARAETFAAGFLEAMGMLDRQPDRPALLVVGDEPIPPPMDAIADHDQGLHAVALLLAREGSGPAVDFAFEVRNKEPRRSAHPDAIEFVRWLLSGERSLRLCHPPHAWVWSRLDV
jgi:hypothetical protein